MNKNAASKVKLLPPIILSIVIGFHIISNCIWLMLDDSYLMHDSHQHHLYSLVINNEMKSTILPSIPQTLEAFERINQSRWHGIFVGYICAPFYFIFGTSQDAGAIINSIIFGILLLFSTYKIGSYCYNNTIGLFAAFLLGSYPIIFNHLRIYMFDLPLTSMVSLSIYFLLKTELLTRHRYIILFSGSVALGLMTKFNFLVFIMGPFFFILFKRMRAHYASISNKRLFVTLIFSLIFFSVIIVPFLIQKYQHIYFRIYECSWLNPIFTDHCESLSQILSVWAITTLRSFSGLVSVLINSDIGFIFFIIFCIGTIMVLQNKLLFKSILFIWLIVPIATILGLFYFAAPYSSLNRYIMPLLPSIALISSAGVMSARYVFVRRVTITLIVLFGLFQYFAVSYNMHAVPDRILMKLPKCMSKTADRVPSITYFRRDIGLPFRNDRDNYAFPTQISLPIDDIIELIYKETAHIDSIINVCFIDNIPEIYEPIEYEGFINKSLDVSSVPLSKELYYDVHSSPKGSTFFNNMHYVLITDRDRNSDIRWTVLSPDIEKRITELRKLFYDHQNEFILTAKFKISNDAVIYVYRNRRIFNYEIK